MAKIEKVHVALPDKSYPIYISDGILDQAGKYIRETVLLRRGRVIVITNRKVFRLYGRRLCRSLNRAGYKPAFLYIGDGERYKNLATIEKKYKELAALQADRQTPVIAFGGGVVGDAAGFVAATYMRGVPFIQVPTTLLSQVDSSVGGKVGVNLPSGKNLVGSFYQPRFVLVDVGALQTLNRKEMRNGIAEVIKYGMIESPTLFKLLQRSADEILAYEPAILRKIIKMSCRIKARIVAEDEKESGIRAILNFGHTVGHSIEATVGYGKYKHGEAVALGMIAAVRMAVVLKKVKPDIETALTEVLQRYGLPVKIKYGKPADIYNGLLHDKKRIAGKLRFILPEAIGAAMIVSPVSSRVVRKGIDALYTQG